MKRPVPLTTSTPHHIYSKSICHFQIFNNPDEYTRFFMLLRYYRFEGLKMPFSKFMRWIEQNKLNFEDTFTHETRNLSESIYILTYCLMPTHFHLILHQTENDKIKRFIQKVCGSYSLYFNLRHNRNGPLWQSRFGNSVINNQQELLETSRYVHLNPTTAYLVDRAENWPYSSFREYTKIKESLFPALCHTEDILKNISIKKYTQFVNNHVEVERQLKKQKH